MVEVLIEYTRRSTTAVHAACVSPWGDVRGVTSPTGACTQPCHCSGWSGWGLPPARRCWLCWRPACCCVSLVTVRCAIPCTPVRAPLPISSVGLGRVPTSPDTRVSGDNAQGGWEQAVLCSPVHSRRSLSLPPASGMKLFPTRLRRTKPTPNSHTQPPPMCIALRPSLLQWRGDARIVDFRDARCWSSRIPTTKPCARLPPLPRLL